MTGEHKLHYYKGVQTLSNFATSALTQEGQITRDNKCLCPQSKTDHSPSHAIRTRFLYQIHPFRHQLLRLFLCAKAANVIAFVPISLLCKVLGTIHGKSIESG